MARLVVSHAGAPLTGGCLCGDISYTVDGPVADIVQCHCEPCRRAAGNYVAAAQVARKDTTITGEQHLRWHDLGYSKYGFCGNCGSHMVWVAAERPEIYSLQVGCIDNTAEIPLAAVWFANEAQSHNHLSPDVPHYVGNGAE